MTQIDRGAWRDAYNSLTSAYSFRRSRRARVNLPDGSDWVSAVVRDNTSLVRDDPTKPFDLGSAGDEFPDGWPVLAH